MAAVVEGAGGLVWRRVPRGELEVLLVHRPKYDDWTLPIGRREPGEAFEVCALREVAEETGYHGVLGDLLTVLEIVGADDGLVHRWHLFAVEASHGAFAPNAETDRAEWLPISEAVARATYPNIRDLLAGAPDLLPARPAGADPVRTEASLAAYYDAEGDERTRRELDPTRVARRDAFIADLTGQAGPAAPRVLEVGSGPGRDAAAFVDAGCRYVGVDLAIEHLRRCRADSGAAVAVASVRHLPLASGSFDAAWTMSTLMHVPDSAIDAALADLRRVLVPGGRAAIGVWGGDDVVHHAIDERHPDRPPRLFNRRSNARWGSMLSALGTVDEFTTWGNDEFFYQWAIVRTPG